MSVDRTSTKQQADLSPYRVEPDLQHRALVRAWVMSDVTAVPCRPPQVECNGEIENGGRLDSAFETC